MDENEPTQSSADNEMPPSVVPSRQSLPPPPEVSYTRPTLGHAAPAQISSPAKGGSKTGEPPTPMDNAARMGAGLSAGITLAASVFVGFLIGQWIDHRFNHSTIPWGTLVMSLAGTAAGFLNLFRILNASEKPRGPK